MALIGIFIGKEKHGMDTHVIEELTPKKSFMDVADLMEELDISRSAAYALVKTPGFPAARITPKRIKIPRAAFERWLEVKTNEQV